MHLEVVNLKNDLNPLDREVFQEAVNELINDGIFEPASSRDWSLRLTRAGAELIYP